jgi:CheY-like chemotaxis protein
MAKVFVVDDEKDMRDLLSLVLLRDGHTTASAASGAEALARIPAEQPNVILLDVTMPDMDGYTVATQLGADDRTRAIPILIMTGKDGVRELFQMTPNVAEFVSKPFDPRALRSAVKTVLEKTASR